MCESSVLRDRMILTDKMIMKHSCNIKYGRDIQTEIINYVLAGYTGKPAVLRHNHKILRVLHIMNNKVFSIVDNVYGVEKEIYIKIVAERGNMEDGAVIVEESDSRISEIEHIGLMNMCKELRELIAYVKKEVR